MDAKKEFRHAEAGAAGSAGLLATFGALRCVRSSCDVDVDAYLRERWLRVGLPEVGVVEAVVTPGDPRIGLLVTWRDIVAAARAEGLPAVLVFDEQALWHEEAAAVLEQAGAELAGRRWQACVLGGYFPFELPLLPACSVLARAAYGMRVHAWALHAEAYEAVLAEWPGEVGLAAHLVAAGGGVDATLAGMGHVYAVQPQVASVPELLPFLPPSLQHAYPG